MAKRKEDAPPAGSPAWMATLSDLMNLLLCFFVMLFAMSTLEEGRLAEFVAAMNNTFSIFDGGATAVGEGILISNGVSQLNELDQYINSTGKTADSEEDGEDFQEFELSDAAQETLESYLNEEKLKENEETADTGKIRPDSGVRTGDMSKDIETMVLGMGIAGIICALALREKLRMKGGS